MLGQRDSINARMAAPGFWANQEAAQEQVSRLQKLRQERDGSQVQATLSRLEQVARSDANTVPAILECVESYCTLGEICQVFRSVFGEQQSSLGI